MARKRQRKSLRRRFLRLLLPFLLLTFVTYTVHQFLNGERGVFTWVDLRKQVVMFHQENTVLKARKDILEKRVNRLHPDRLDEDFLDEEIRRRVPYLKPNELVIYLPRDDGDDD